MTRFNEHARICTICGCEHSEGYLIAGRYYACCDDCLCEIYKLYGGAKSDEEARDEYRNDNREDDSEYCYVNWC